MKAFVVNKGAQVFAVDFSNPLNHKIEKKKIKRESLYFLEDVQVDPAGSVGVGPAHHSLGGSWAAEGFYGFSLPVNDQGYDLMLVHSKDLSIQ